MTSTDDMKIFHVYIHTHMHIYMYIYIEACIHIQRNTRKSIFQLLCSEISFIAMDIISAMNELKGL